MKCCENRTTNFCPDCGEPITASPLRGLFKHVNTHVKQRLVALQAEEESVRATHHGRTHEKRLRTAYNKWKSWADALEQVMPEENKATKGKP